MDNNKTSGDDEITSDPEGDAEEIDFGNADSADAKDPRDYDPDLGSDNADDAEGDVDSDPKVNRDYDVDDI